jgi:hypothetical protein
MEMMTVERQVVNPFFTGELRKNTLLEPLCSYSSNSNDQFTKTGSGQTQEK